MFRKKTNRHKTVKFGLCKCSGSEYEQNKAENYIMAKTKATESTKPAKDFFFTRLMFVCSCRHHPNFPTHCLGCSQCERLMCAYWSVSDPACNLLASSLYRGSTHTGLVPPAVDFTGTITLTSSSCQTHCWWAWPWTWSRCSVVGRLCTWGAPSPAGWAGWRGWRCPGSSQPLRPPGSDSGSPEPGSGPRPHAPAGRDTDPACSPPDTREPHCPWNTDESAAWWDEEGEEPNKSAFDSLEHKHKRVLSPYLRELLMADLHLFSHSCHWLNKSFPSTLSGSFTAWQAAWWIFPAD